MVNNKLETIRYAKDNIEFTRELRAKVKDYFLQNQIQQYGNWQIIIKTIVMALIYSLPYLLLVAGIITSVPGVLTCFFIMGFGMTGLGMTTMHDANHGSFSKNKRTNFFVSKSLYLLGGFPPNWRIQHNMLHHGYTNIEGHDEDIAPPGILRFSPHRPQKKIHRYQHIYAWFFYGLMTVSWITMKDFKNLTKYRKMGSVLNGKKGYRQLMADLIISKILYYSILLLIPLLVLPVAWYWVVAGFLLMHFTGGLILSTIFQSAHVVPSSEFPLPEGNSEMSNNWVAHQLYTTCDFSPDSRIFSWMVGGLNFQVIHHLFPNISHIHYKKLAPIVQSTAQKYGLPYYVNPTFAIAVKEHVRMLKILGREVAYEAAYEAA